MQELSKPDKHSTKQDRENGGHVETTEPELPRMPAAPAAADRAAGRLSLRRFHLTGERHAEENAAASPLFPAALISLLDETPDWKLYPLVLTSPKNGVDDAGSVSLFDLLEQEFDRLGESGEAPSVLASRLAELVRIVNRRLVESGGVAPLRPTLRDACVTLALSLGPEETTALQEESSRLDARLPAAGSLVASGPGVLPTLYVAAMERRRQTVARFRTEVGELVHRLSELLRVDADNDPGSMAPQSLSATLGGAADGFVNPDLLSKNVPPPRGSRRLDRDRRLRIEQALQELNAYLESGTATHDLLLVHSGALADARLPTWVSSIQEENPVGAAAGLFDDVAAHLIATIRACRIAWLEADGRYDPEVHDALLSPLDWRDLPEDELLLIPVVAVFESANRLRERSLADFSELMYSGRPVQLLVEESCRLNPTETATGNHVALGYLAVAHREVFVLQSTLARPSHLFSGLVRMVGSARPATAIVAVAPDESALGPISELGSALAGRATPCYCYDAAAGTSWAERFDMEGNPEPGRRWPKMRYRFLDADDDEQEKEESFTFAHSAAIDPAYRDGFRVISAGEWDEDQLEVADYLELAVDQQPKRLPFVWVRDQDRTLARAVATRRVVFACRDRLRAWQVYQELAGTDNAYVERASREARQAALEEAEQARSRLVQAHADELEQVRVRSADQAVERLIGALLDGDLAVPDASAPFLPSATASEATAGTDASVVAAEDGQLVEESFTIEEPCIDSMMCTTCNDCTKINPQMFKYNEDQQAYIADLAAGTFAQLVRAAEKCPARCIHPGNPRPGDKTATRAMVARAAPFNE